MEVKSESGKEVGYWVLDALRLNSKYNIKVLIFYYFYIILDFTTQILDLISKIQTCLKSKILVPLEK
jgi:hypothetical protein